MADFYSGMEVDASRCFAAQLCTGETMADMQAPSTPQQYTGPVRALSGGAACKDGFLSAAALSGTDSMEICRCPATKSACARWRVYDNLGKGASGAALECLNLVLGADKGLRP